MVRKAMSVWIIFEIKCRWLKCSPFYVERRGISHFFCSICPRGVKWLTKLIDFQFSTFLKKLPIEHLKKCVTKLKKFCCWFDRHRLFIRFFRAGHHSVLFFYGCQLYLGENWCAKSTIFSFFQFLKNHPSNIKKSVWQSFIKFHK